MAVGSWSTTDLDDGGCLGATLVVWRGFRVSVFVFFGVVGL